jgi:hypothetical protein
MQRFSRYGWWFAVFGIMAFLVVALRQCGIDPVPSARSLDDWELSELVEHLNVRGLNVHLRSTQENGAIAQTAFLTLTDRNWRSLNALKKDKKCIHEWRGVLFCERVGESDTAHFADQWGDQCLTVGPFLFYGDVELLHRVRSALTSSAPLELH